MDRSTARLARPAIAMAKLVLSSGGSILYQCFLDKERVKVGRAPRNQVVIDDPGVDAEHAVVLTVGNDHILEDLQSVNGTFVNDMMERCGLVNVFDEGDAVAQLQLALFQPLQPQQIRRRRLMQRVDRRIEIAMFLLQPGELVFQLALIIVGHGVR